MWRSERRGPDAEQLFREHHVALRRYLIRMCGDAEMAEDALQESYLRLVERPPAQQDEIRGWLFTVATNVVREVARTEKRRDGLLRRGAGRAPVADPAPPADARVESSELREAVRELLHRLSERERAMVMMREEGFSYREIARAVGVQPKSVGALIVRAFRKLEPDVARLNEVWS